MINEVFGAHWQEESWHEVLRLICGMIEPKFVAEIIDFLLEQKADRSQFLNQTTPNLKKEGINNIILAVNCFEEVRNKNLISSTSEKLLQTLKNEIEQEFPYRFMPDTAFDLLLLIANNWQDEQETLSWLKHCLKLDLSSFVPAAAVKTIAEVWKDYPDTLPWLKELALVKQEDQNDDVQQIAVQSIVKHWLNHSETLLWLKEFALINENPSVRREALRVLAKELKKDEDNLSMLKTYALQDESWFVRYTALEALAMDWKDEPNTLKFLKNRIVEDDDYPVRFQALQILERDWKEEPDTLEFLKDRYLNDKSEFVRYVAVRAIIRCWKNDPQLFEFLCKITLNYPFKREYFFQDNPRQTALEGLLENFSDNPKTLEILNQVALNDSDEQLREFAVKKLQDLKNVNP